MFFKNVASQLITVHAWDTANNDWKSGDAGNITAYISKDGGAAAQTNDVNPSELSAANMKGAYQFSMLKAESNCDHLSLVGASSTANIIIIPVSLYPTTLTSTLIAYLDAAISSRATPAQVNTQVSDVLKTDTIAELAADPGTTPTFEKALMLWYMFLRNQQTQTATLQTIRNNAGGIVLQATCSDDDTTFTKGKFAVP